MVDILVAPPAPPLKITLGDKVFKMTYGLEMDIRRMLPDPVSALQLVQSDPYTQDYLIRRVLTEKNAMLKMEDLIDIESVTLTSEEVEQTLSWVVEHALYFFVKRALAMEALGATYQSVLPTPSKDGSQASPSMTPSAGALAA